jgi:predicted transcriptional regulator
MSSKTLKSAKDSTNKIQVHVDGLQDMGKRFVSAWKRAEKGEPVNETHITFLDVEAMVAALSPRRLELLRHVRQHGAANTRELSMAIGRDYKNVHQDVAALEAVGLLLRDGRKLSAPWDEVQASVALVPAA